MKQKDPRGKRVGKDNRESDSRSLDDTRPVEIPGIHVLGEQDYREHFGSPVADKSELVNVDGAETVVIELRLRRDLLKEIEKRARGRSVNTSSYIESVLDDMVRREGNS